MSFNSFADSVNRKFQEISSQVSQRAQEAQLDKKFKDLSTAVSQKTQDFTTQLPSLAQSTQRLMQEKLGQVTDISQLPQDYVELENKIDRMKLACLRKLPESHSGLRKRELRLSQQCEGLG